MFLLLALYRPEAMVQPATDHFTQTGENPKSGNDQGTLTMIVAALSGARYRCTSKASIAATFTIHHSNT